MCQALFEVLFISVAALSSPTPQHFYPYFTDKGVETKRAQDLMTRQWERRDPSHISCHSASASNRPAVLGTTHLALIISYDYTSPRELQAPH